QMFHFASALEARLETWSDRALVLAIAAALFALGAWPLFFLPLPPYQDLPDHLATVCVLLDPAKYPDFASHGFLKANALFVVATYALAKFVGVVAAGKIFALAVIAASSVALPAFVLAFTDRRRLLVASLVCAPMVHTWWTLMGMLNFSAAFPLALALLVAL